MPADNPWGIWAAGDFEVAVRHWGDPEIPSYWGPFQMNYLVGNAGTGDTPGQSFDLEVDSPSRGRVDLVALVETAKTAPTEEEQTEALKTMAIVFNELLPRIPIRTYTYLAPALEGVRVASFDEDHPAARNQIYRDNHVMLALIQGDLRAWSSGGGPEGRAAAVCGGATGGRVPDACARVFFSVGFPSFKGFVWEYSSRSFTSECRGFVG